MTAISKDTGFEHPEDGMYMIEPAGEHLEREGRVIQVIDSSAIASIVENFNAAAQDPSFSGMLIDHEHFKHDLEKETIAYGWLMRLQGRADGIYGQIRWTSTGQAAVDGGDYRFFSTEYDPEDLEVLSDTEPKRVRPLKLDGLTLTNAPNNKMGRPITNRGSGESTTAETPERKCRALGLVVNRIQRERRCTFDVAWNIARQQQPTAFTGMVATPPRPTAAPALNRAAASDIDFPRLASELLLSKAQSEKLARGGPFEEHWKLICNRSPRLVRIANRQDGWDALADLEPAAHAEYMRAKANPNVFSGKIRDAQAAVRSQFPNLRPEEQTQKLAELYPQELSGYRLEQAASNPRFEAALQGITVEYPDLGFEGRWEKLKELYPKLFWQFVLEVGSKSEEGT